MKTAIVSTAIAGGLMLAPVAQAATGYTNGIGGIGPQWTTITGPNGEKCNCGFLRPGERIVPRNNFSVESYEAAQIAWLEAHQNEDNVIWTYSASSQSIVNLAEKRPDLFTRTKVIALAPPKAGSLGYNQIDGPNAVDMTQVIVKNDSVADENGTSLETHRTGYNNLNMQTQQPVSSSTLSNTNTKRNYYEKAPTTSWLAKLFGFRSTKSTSSAQQTQSVTESSTEKQTTESATQTTSGSDQNSSSTNSGSARAEKSGANDRAERRKARRGARAERRAQRSSEDS